MVKLTKQQEYNFEEWLYNFFDGDEDEVVANFYNNEYREWFLEDCYATAN